MRKGKFKFTNKSGQEEQVALETVLDQIVDSPVRALQPNTDYQRGEIVFDKTRPLMFLVCGYSGRTGDQHSLRVFNDAGDGDVKECGTAMFIVRATLHLPTQAMLKQYAKLESPHFTGIPTAPTADSSTNNTQIATTEFVKTALASVKIPEAVTVGTVIAFAGNSVPSGYLMCNGAAVSRTTYAALYKAIGTTYGTGNGSTTFNLPNLIDKFVQGSNTAGTAKNAGLPNITGQFRVRNNIGYGNIIDYPPSGAFKEINRNIRSEGNADDNRLDKVYEFNASYSNSIYGSSSTVQPPALTMLYIIKY